MRPGAVGALLALTSAAGRTEVKTGDEFPALARARIVNLAGGGEALPDLTGKVVLVDFWASWCAPCKASFPVMARLHADYAARGFVIAAVSIDDKASAAAAFAKKMAPPFATLLDPEKKLVQQVDVPAMPASYLLDRHGRVRFVHQGFHGDATERELRQHIETLLAEKD
jgi:thiol-disulfide isomerase/thioredoxin